jgi:hypothetical protein
MLFNCFAHDSDSFDDDDDDEIGVGESRAALAPPVRRTLFEQQHKRAAVRDKNKEHPG